MNELPTPTRFLTRAEVDYLHALSLERHGGIAGVNSESGLESAIMMPQQGFGGQYVHQDLAAMAAAYMFRIAQSQAYNDGNKRAGAAAGIAFLAANGIEVDLPDDEIYDLLIAITRTDGPRATKQDLAEFIRRHLP